VIIVVATDLLHKLRVLIVDSDDHISMSQNILAALKGVCKRAVQHDQTVVVAGSLYLVGDVFRLVRQHETKDGST